MFILLIAFLFGNPPERTKFLLSDKPELQQQGLVRLQMPGCCGSMRPVIRGKELTYAEPYIGQPVYVGDIVMTKKYTHRVIATSKTHVLTAGDANRYNDGWSPKSELRFIVRYIVRQ